jgi:hypothetical protein
LRTVFILFRKMNEFHTQEGRIEFLNFKQLRIITTSLLLFQNFLFPITAFAVEGSSETDIEVVESTQAQEEAQTQEEAASSEINEVAETTEDTVTPEEASTEQATSVGEETPATVEEVPIVQGPPTLEEQTTNGIISELPANTSPTQLALPPLLRQTRVAFFNSLPNLAAYEGKLRDNGQSSYIVNVLQQAINNKEITLKAAVNSDATFQISLSTYSMVTAAPNDWISYIASDKAGIPEYYYQKMYYGDAPNYASTFGLTNLGTVNISPYLKATITFSSSSKMLNVTVTRTQATTEAEGSFDISGDVQLGTTAVTVGTATEYRQPIKVLDYTNVTLGTIKVKNEAPTHAIKSNVDVEAQRGKDLSTDTIKSWFSVLPSNADSYTYQVTSGPSTWEPGTSGNATVTVSLGSTSTSYSTNYTVKDTTPPDGKLKDSLKFEEGSAEPDLRELLDGDPTDNWTLPENMKLAIAFENGKKFSELPVGEHEFTLTLTDESGNYKELTGKLTILSSFAIQSDVVVEAQRNKDLTTDTLKSWFTTLPDNADAYDYQVISGPEMWEPKATGKVTVAVKNKSTNNTQQFTTNYSVVDTTPPDGKLKDSLEFEEGSTDLNLRELLDGDPTDNWTLPENMKLAIAFENGKKFSELPVGEHAFTLTLTDESGNNKELTGKLTILSSFVIQSNVVVEAQRSKELSMDILKTWFTTLPAEADGYDYQVISGPETWAPKDSGEVTVAVENKSTNSTQQFTTNYSVVDTTPPDGKLKDSLEFEEGSAEPDLRELLDGDPTDNWSLPENIKLEITFENGKKFSELPVGEHNFTLALVDENSNKKELTGSLQIFSKNTYIDVVVPAKMNFAQDKSSDGIVSPIYKIQNNSERALTVSVDSMTSIEQTERLPELTLGMKSTQLNQDVLLVSNGQNLSNSVELATLSPENDSYQFSFFGSAGSNIDLGYEVMKKIHPSNVASTQNQLHDYRSLYISSLLQSSS